MLTMSKRQRRHRSTVSPSPKLSRLPRIPLTRNRIDQVEKSLYGTPKLLPSEETSRRLSHQIQESSQSKYPMSFRKSRHLTKRQGPWIRYNMTTLDPRDSIRANLRVLSVVDRSSEHRMEAAEAPTHLCQVNADNQLADLTKTHPYHRNTFVPVDGSIWRQMIQWNR